MDDHGRDEVPMLSDTHPDSSNEHLALQIERFMSRTRSASISIPMNSMDAYERGEVNLVGHTGPLRTHTKSPFLAMSGPLHANRGRPDNVLRLPQGVAGQEAEETTAEKFPSTNVTNENEWTNDDYTAKNEHLLRSGQLGMCNDPYCTTCPTVYKPTHAKYLRPSGIFDQKFHNALYGDAKGWARRFFSCLRPYIPGVMNPHAKIVQQWNQFFVITCLIAIFLDPLFFFLLSVQKDKKCIVIDQPLTTTFVVFRSMTDLIYLMHILLQFRLAYVAPESRVVGAGELVDHPKKIALNYLKGYFLIDFFVVLPLPQIILLVVLPKNLGSSGANYAKNLLRAAVLLQYIPRLSGHIVGSCWYLFGLQRVNQCLRDACNDSKIVECMSFIDCGHGSDDEDSKGNNILRDTWKNNSFAGACFYQNGFDYGIYAEAVNLTTENSVITRYVYALFWGFQQISTLAGNQTPSYFVWEVLFTMAIIGLGLLLFALLIGNMQNFLQALGRRRLEMSLRRRDVEQWMSHRRLPDELRRRVRQAERYNWAATRGVNEEMLLEVLPEDLQTDIRRHLFKFIKKVRIFALMDEPILDSICGRLRQKTYIQGSKVLYRGGLIEKMVFVVRGKMASIGEDGIRVSLSEGDVCGEELLTWCLEHSSVNKDGKKIRIPGQRMLSNRTVICLTNVEAFSLRAADIGEVTSLFARFLRNPRVQGAIRYESPYWRGLAARCIQVAWRYRRKRLQSLRRADTSQSNHAS
ncbi:probable cyclic nucleotide-gated ion channel 20, chloroplastic isoform X2 [Argentina anserina]|uniref:probable cyclic nucleotide-gated ion channel 20, chloroplastic isoform X2 n=1 Tax=Argentina anserina TaxID=57926 RepID=UPI00217672AC|nr:probable cyclic nucleotide-gated ion channel 20, chloroplastic isoform X2 [Potentilla anserina]